MPSPLSAAQLTTIAQELAEGRPTTVWFTPAAVGVDAGKSAKVTALTDPAEGDFIQVKPTGSKDVLSFSPNELTLDKPPRVRKPAAEPESQPRPTRPEPKPMDELLVVRERPVATPPKPKEPEPARPAGRGRTKQPSPVTVTLSSTEEGEWTVEVITGKKRTVRPTAVPASSVAQAARLLGADVAEAIEGVIDAARDRQRARVARLQAELEAARQALAELSE